VDLSGLDDLPPLYISRETGSLRPQVSVAHPTGNSPAAAAYNLRNSIFAAEVAASRRLLAQLDAQTTRVGVITFSDDARVQQALTHDFARVRDSLADIYRAGPYGATNMVDGIRLGIKELLGLGGSEQRPDAIKTQLLLTDGLPSLPIGAGKRSTPEDTQLTVNAARLAGKAGVKVHVFGLGYDVVHYPYAAQGIARASGGSYIPLARPADLLVAMESLSTVDVQHVQVLNQTTGEQAVRTRLAPDGLFGAAVPMAEGLNQLEVFARAGSGNTSRASITVYYEPGTQRSLALDIFLEREKNLQVEVDRLGKSREQVQAETERLREQTAPGQQ
jgi:hypothetical protein